MFQLDRLVTEFTSNSILVLTKTHSSFPMDFDFIIIAIVKSMIKVVTYQNTELLILTKSVSKNQTKEVPPLEKRFLIFHFYF